MTAPKTNVEKQQKRHYGPLIGIVVAVIVAGLLALFWAGGDDITEKDAQDGATEIEQTTQTPEVVTPEPEATQ